MLVAIGSDHRGYQLKAHLIDLLKRLEHTPHDCGTHDTTAIDYPDIAIAVAQQVTSGAVDRGILICGTGIGMCITANKLNGIRAATCYDELAACTARQHNDLNILCLSADMLGAQSVERIVETFLSTPFDGGRHARRLEKISQLEQSRIVSG